ncbi:MAG: hypothetical protein KatS3mg082_1573 [Nitrospiraceae bacterium]|nr:MAG: hypothetical protein KatS3mg082_1573 [Nitrospiraceae bacterium]
MEPSHDSPGESRGGRAPADPPNVIQVANEMAVPVCSAISPTPTRFVGVPMTVAMPPGRGGKRQQKQQARPVRVANGL